MGFYTVYPEGIPVNAACIKIVSGTKEAAYGTNLVYISRLDSRQKWMEELSTNG